MSVELRARMRTARKRKCGWLPVRPCTAFELALAFAFGLSPGLADAHLINTGLGPVCDGITHFALSPEDFLPAIALALLTGLRGKSCARGTTPSARPPGRPPCRRRQI